MWFKNLLVYRFTKPFNKTAEELDSLLSEKPFKPCGSQDQTSFGWVPPLGQQGSEYIHTTNGYIMLSAQRQERVLPAAVINEALAEKVEEIKQGEGRAPGRKERVDLKEEIIFSLLPRAFTRSSKTFAYIAPAEGLLIVNAGSHKRAEELLTYLRETVGSLPVIPATANNVPQHAMTEWLREGEAPQGFEFGGECELRAASDETAVIRCKNQELTSEEINNHLQSGMFVNKLSLSWEGDIDFMVDDQLTLKRLNFGDLIQDKLEQVDTEDGAEQFDVDFSIMTAEFARFIPAVMGAFGGEDLTDCGAVIAQGDEQTAA